ncbi:hypothetical protein ES702_01308 [subsurface metagenome]
MPIRSSPTNYRIQVIIEPDGPGFHAYCPALEGLHTCGETEEEALKNAKDAISAYLQSLIKHNDPIPVGILPPKGIKETTPIVNRLTKRHTEEFVLALS